MSQCAKCKKKFSGAKFIDCGVCNKKLHTKCAAESVPGLTETVIECIRTSKDGAYFKCKECLQMPRNDATSSSDIASRLNMLEASIKQFSKIVSDDVIDQLKGIKEELAKCTAKAEQTENYVKDKIKQLEIENYGLRRQLNRADVMINGLPTDLNIDELHTTIFKMGSVFNVDVKHSDLHLCTYIKNKKVVLVKFNSIYKRDQFFKNYISNKNLRLNQILETDIQARVYVNDNLTPLASKMKYICRKLMRENKIKKFTLINKNRPEVKIVYNNGDEKAICYDKLLEMSKEPAAPLEPNN